MAGDPRYLAMLEEQHAAALQVLDEQRDAMTPGAIRHAVTIIDNYAHQIAAVRQRDAAERAANQARAPYADVIGRGIDHGIEFGYDGRSDIDKFFNIHARGTEELLVDSCGLEFDVVNGRSEVRAIQGYSGAGSLTVVNPMVANFVYETLLDVGAIWQTKPTITSVPVGNPLRFPTMTAAGTATITNESGTIAESDPTLSSVTITPNKYAHLLRVSNEALQDSNVQLASFILDHAGFAMAQAYGGDFSGGSGAGSLTQGYLTGAAGSIVAAGTCSPDSLLRMIYNTPPPFRRNSVFAMNDGVASYLRRLRGDAGGTTGPFLFPPFGLNANDATNYGNQNGGALQGNGLYETFAGYRVVIDNSIPAHGSGVASVAFGDFSKYYILDAGLKFLRSDDFAFNQDQAVYRATWRLSGRVLDGRAFTKYVANAN